MSNAAKINCTPTCTSKRQPHTAICTSHHAIPKPAQEKTHMAISCGSNATAQKALTLKNIQKTWKCIMLTEVTLMKSSRNHIKKHAIRTTTNWFTAQKQRPKAHRGSHWSLHKTRSTQTWWKSSRDTGQFYICRQNAKNYSQKHQFLHIVETETYEIHQGGWGCEVSCGGHHRPKGKTTTGSALDGAVFDIAQILAYLVHNMSRSQLYLGFGHFGWLPSFFGQ